MRNIVGLNLIFNKKGSVIIVKKMGFRVIPEAVK